MSSVAFNWYLVDSSVFFFFLFIETFQRIGCSCTERKGTGVFFD